MNKMNRVWIVFVAVLVNAVCSAVSSSPIEDGPRLSDEELLASLDPDFKELHHVISLRDRKETAAALSALVAFIRAKEELADFGQRAERNPQADTSRAQRMIGRRVVVVGIPHTFVDDIDWGFNPTTAPGAKHERDHEWTWQLNRHGAWVTLARAYQVTGEERFAREFDAQFSDWVTDCPVPTNGANQRPYSKWRTIEAGIRMSWTWPAIFTIFRKSPSVQDRTLIAMTKSMVEHGRYLRRYPTSGNWLTMEMNGLYHVGVLLGFVREANDWRRFALSRLLEELDTQVYPDGAQIELTPGYHNVALRSFLGPVDIAGAYGYRLPDEYLAKLERMFAYNMWVMRPDRDAPRWNDSWPVDVVGALRKGLHLFPHRKDFEWIVTDGREGAPPDHTSHFFPHAGQVVMRSGWERDALFLGFEAGPFGYGHQHEDKLGIVMICLRPLVISAGGSTKEGVAGKYVGDEGIEKDPDVIVFTDFDSEEWREHWSGGGRPTVRAVAADEARNFESLQGKALRIKVVKGDHYGASLQYHFKKRVGSEPEEIYFRYYLRFGSDWNPRRGGKLPGVGGTYGRAGWGGRRSSGRNGWSARGQFKGRRDGKTPIGFYCYHADMRGRYGSAWIWQKDKLGYLENNRWYCIEQYVKMNTPGKNDGVLRGWVDGKLAFEKANVRMRDVPYLKIECIWINIYHGGTWSAESDDHLFIDNMVIAKRYIGPMLPRSSNMRLIEIVRDETDSYK